MTRTVVLMACAFLLAGCVVEETTTRVRTPFESNSAAKAPPTGPRGGSSDVELPRDVVSPALGAESRTNYVRVAIQALGHVPYDAQTLPLVRRDGRYVAVQDGEAPTWTAVLAEDGALPAASTVVRTYAITDKGPVAAAVLPPGVLLGRNAGIDGFMVEAPQADGARWLGVAAWETGEITWLVRDDRVNAFAVRGMAPARRLAFTRRVVGSEARDLVIRQGTAEYVVGAREGSWLHPVWCDGGDPDRSARLTALRLESDGRLLLVSVRIDPTLSQHEITASQLLTRSGTIEDAHQCFAGVQHPCSSPDIVPTPLARDQRGGVLFFHPDHQRIARFDPGAGTVRLLDPRGVAADWLADGRVLLCTSDSLVLRDPAASRSGAVVLRTPYVPRATPTGVTPALLIAPVKDAKDRLALVRLAPSPPGD
jgi:hypothetical protein